VCRYYNGDYYEGEWLDGLRSGCGMQQCTDDSNYVGALRPRVPASRMRSVPCRVTAAPHPFGTG